MLGCVAWPASSTIAMSNTGRDTIDGSAAAVHVQTTTCERSVCTHTIRPHLCTRAESCTLWWTHAAGTVLHEAVRYTAHGRKVKHFPAQPTANHYYPHQECDPRADRSAGWNTNLRVCEHSLRPTGDALCEILLHVPVKEAFHLRLALVAHLLICGKLGE